MIGSMQISAPCTPGICRNDTLARPANCLSASLSADFSAGFSACLSVCLSPGVGPPGLAGLSAPGCGGSIITTSPNCITSAIRFGVAPRSSPCNGRAQLTSARGITPRLGCGVPPRTPSPDSHPTRASVSDKPSTTASCQVGSIPGFRGAFANNVGQS